MTDPTTHDRRVDAVVDRLEDELVDAAGNPVERDVVASAVLAAAAELAEAPVQEFVPLLVENQALDDLRQRGLHRELDGVDDDGPPPPPEAPPTIATPTSTPPV